MNALSVVICLRSMLLQTVCLSMVLVSCVGSASADLFTYIIVIHALGCEASSTRRLVSPVFRELPLSSSILICGKDDELVELMTRRLDFAVGSLPLYGFRLNAHGAM